MKSRFSQDRLVAAAILIISVAYFIGFVFPNAVASEDLKMVTIFEPDEGAPLPYVFKMIKPADNLKQVIYNFVTYEYYFYGFPYFAYSALIILPIKFLGSLTNHYPEVMLTLRQLVSVLPVMLAAYVLVRMPTNTRRSFWSVFLYLFLLAIPAVVRNNFWWHPDGLNVLAVVAVIYFLAKDDLKYGKNFFLAALACGVAAGIKFSGVYFFLTIPVYLLWGLAQKKLTLKKMIWRGIVFVLVMVAGFLMTNPLFIFAGPRDRYIEVFRRQSMLLNEGFYVVYSKGLAASSPIITFYFGSWLFMILALLAPVIGIIRNQDRLLNVIILTWSLPLTVFVLTVTHFKFQYWLPVALPLFSSLAVYFPDLKALREGFSQKNPRKIAWYLLTVAAVAVVVVQFASFIRTDVDLFRERMVRAETSASLNFIDEAAPYLGELVDKELYVYHDVRLYIPDSSPWATFSAFDLLRYSYFEAENPAIILLMQQRIRDYLNPNVTGIDPEQLEISREFYRDADQGAIEGYRLVYRNDFGLAFVREDIYQEYLAD